MSGIGRVAGIGAVIAAVVLVAFVLFGGGSGGGYTVTAKFINAGQLVKGNPVQAGGTAIGTVQDLKITPDGQAAIKLKIKDSYAPLREGTRAAIRQFSLSGIANRYVDLTLPPNGAAEIKDGGRIDIARTRTAVDLDQLFNTIDPETRKALQDFFKGQARQFANRGQDANDAFQYLNPAFSTSSRLFNELSKDQPTLERFLVDSSRLVTALAERRDDLSGLIGNLNDTTRALGNQKLALAESIERLPPFMRRANTTFVNLRAALDDVDPLVDASKPVAKQLAPFLSQARAFAADAEPTVRDLRLTVRRAGRDNDLINFLATVPPLADIAVETKRRTIAPGNRKVSVGETKGAFPETVEALDNASPVIGFARPYTTDFFGWFDDFSTTGGFFDANGAIGRGQFSFAENFPQNGFAPPKTSQFRRCPGGADVPAPDGSNVLSQAEQNALGCRESDRAVR
ncbi:MAG TPA: MlaD family protein [Thermoleophilaceae bacterium]|nr:MlaD family protein [Thermoleophilaceae bacterium]